MLEKDDVSFVGHFAMPAGYPSVRAVVEVGVIDFTAGGESARFCRYGPVVAEKGLVDCRPYRAVGAWRLDVRRQGSDLTLGSPPPLLVAAFLCENGWRGRVRRYERATALFQPPAPLSR